MEVPVLLLNSSPHMWPMVPLPGVANDTRPGLALRYFTRSAKSLTGSAVGFTTTTPGALTISVTPTKSLIGL
ncbi:hypothetical protein D3C72_2253460 [compost metagenome]